METEAEVLQRDAMMPLYVVPEDEQLLHVYEEVKQDAATRASSILVRGEDGAEWNIPERNLLLSLVRKDSTCRDKGFNMRRLYEVKDWEAVVKKRFQRGLSNALSWCTQR